ncbi:MAG: antirestriction protein ArdA [Elainellaceae cyanobacterium]
MSDNNPRIYVSCLASYNNGILHGAWIDLEDNADADDIKAEIDEMLKASSIPNAEEWRIDDYDEFPNIETYDLGAIAEVAIAIHAHGLEPIKAWIEHIGTTNIKAELDNFGDNYIGQYTSERAFCEDYLGETINPEAEKIPVFGCDRLMLSGYIDWNSIANDAFINYFWSHKESHEAIHVFAR